MSRESIEDESLATDANVWTTTGRDAITCRVIEHLNQADDEIMLIVTDESVITDQLLDRVRAAHDRGVTLSVGTLSASIHEQLTEVLPDDTLVTSALNWLHPQREEETDEAIGRLLLVDRETLLVSSLDPHSPATEAALWSEGSGTGLVVIARRLLAAALDADDGLGESVDV